MDKFTCIGKTSDVIKRIRDLRKRNLDHSLTIVEDLSILQLRFKYNFEVVTFIFNSEENYSEEAKKTIDLYLSISQNSYSISAKTYELITTKENSQGLLAVIKMPTYRFEDFKNKELIIVTDNLENAGNLGTILRTCDAAKVDLLINVDGSVNLNNYKVASSSRGMLLKVPVIDATYEEAQNFLLDNNYDIYLGEPDLGKSYKEFDYKEKTAIVVGAERYGINPKWYDHKHIKVFIPMYGQMGCLNVGVAASILLYEAREKKEKNNLQIKG